MTKDEMQQIRTIVYDAYCEGDTEAEWMLVVIDAELAKPEPEHAATIMRFPAGDYTIVKAKLTLPAYELPDGTLLYTAPVDTPQDPKQAAIEQVSPTHYDQTALELCEVCGWKTLIPGDCCLNCERGKVEQEPAPAPQREWQSLTDDDIIKAFNSLDRGLNGFLKTWGWLTFAKAIEAAIRAKNSGEQA